MTKICKAALPVQIIFCPCTDYVKKQTLKIVQKLDDRQVYKNKTEKKKKAQNGGQENIT